MSIALLIRPRGAPASAARLVPVATRDVFKEHWAPGCHALGLRWVPLFETGFPLAMPDVPDVLQELRSFAVWTRQHAPASVTVIGERIDRLISELGALEGSSDDIEVFIG